MTKKDYVMIAKIIDSYPGWSIPKRDLANKLADSFERANPKFDRVKFLQACGVIYGEGR